MDTIYSINYSLTQYLLGSMATLCGIFILKMMSDIYVHHNKLTKAAKKFPGPPTIPLLGNAWQFIRNIEDSFEVMIKIAKNYTTCRIWIGPRLIIVVTNPKDIERKSSKFRTYVIQEKTQVNNRNMIIMQTVMTNHETSKKSFVHEFMEPLVVNSLMNGYGPKMRAHRKFLEPLINGEYLTNYMETFNHQVHHFVNVLVKKVGTREFDIYNEMAYCIADIAFETVLGIPGVGQNQGDLTISHAVDNFLETLYQRTITPWLHPSCFFNLSKHGKACKTATTTIHTFIYKLIEEKRKLHMALANGEPGIVKPKPSILDLWMENIIETDAMNDQEIAYDLITLFTGIQDTILGIFSFAVLMLAMHPDIQEKVREEVISVIGTDNDVTEDSIGKLSYTHMVIKETIRLFPVGPFLPREVTDDLEIDGYTLPKGSMVAMMAMLTHRSKKYWEEPDKFIPERFSSENSKDRHPFAYIPFSGGLRKCPGSKFGVTVLKVMIAQFIRKCRLSTNMKLESLKLKMHISVRSQDGYKISIENIDSL